MDAATAALASWQLPLLPATLAVLAVLLYWRGWRALRAQLPAQFGAARLAAFLAGVTTVILAVASPIDAFAPLLLRVHMLQHILLTMVAPPLLWLGAPALPLLRGLPQGAAKHGLGPFLAWPPLLAAGRFVVHPLVAWLALVIATLLWHLPGPYQLALRDPDWHQFEHACFLVAGLLFWFPVVQPYPSRARWPRWAMVPYLLLADAQNTLLAALFVFADRPLYAAYAAAPALTALDARGDQAAAGALMWVAGSATYLVAAAAIVIGWLNGSALAPRAAPPRPPPAPRRRLDLLRVPRLGAALRSLALRRAAQALMLLLAAAVIADGLLGPRMSPMNLAGVLPWTYWRGLVVIALLAVGNVFCMACPFMLPRALGRRLLPGRRAWPRRLRGKWLAAALLVVYLCAYEAFALWDAPRLTAAIALAYFAAALVVDGIFRGAAFCKHLCPIGQFHFVHATVSPFTIAARDPETCRSCAGADCIRGTPTRRGCELELFVPEKRGNLDCTLCLDCVRACPHDNVGLLAVAPAAELATDPPRSSLRRLSERPDIAALALLCVFGAFANAAGMLEPVLRAEAALAARLGLDSPLALTLAALPVALVALPVAALGSAVAIGHRWSGATATPRALACRLALALVPIGLAMWSAHFLFHFATGIGTAVPVAQRALADLGVALGSPDWSHAAAMHAPAWLTPLELLLLDAGLLLSLSVGWRTALELNHGRGRPAVALHLPWAALAIALWVAGAWIVFQPMQMRGMVH
ncbi:cytochrome c oxidase assembly protein [bacterium]|nr:cytochrome c oxidase assembly protein [bacterium]